MGFIKWCKRLFGKIFFRSNTRLGLYGPPNSGKTTLANRICADWLGEEMGTTSRIAHETRQVRQKEKIVIKNSEGKTITFSLADTPGIATRIDYKEFMRHGLSEEDAKLRAKEATQGIIDGVDWLDKMDCVIVVLDSTKEPHNQVNVALIKYLAEHMIPVLVVANKIDLKKSDVERIATAFPDQQIISISAKNGDNIDKFYESLFAFTAKVKW